jgi:hypothetical protein
MRMSQDDIDAQIQLLNTHRRNLVLFLQQQASIGINYAPPGIVNSIYDTRLIIQNIKAVLHAWGVDIEDHPNDEVPEYVVSKDTQPTRKSIKKPMTASAIQKRYLNRKAVDFAVRLIPKEDFHPDGMLGKDERKYVFIGDYNEQQGRSIRQILANLWTGDSFDRVDSMNIEWMAIIFEIGALNRKKFDIMPGTWKSVFRIVSDQKRLGLIEMSEEEKLMMGRPPRDYYSKDQLYWYNRLTTSERRYSDIYGSDYLIHSYFGINNLCFRGDGITSKENSSTTPSRVFFVKNIELAKVKYRFQVFESIESDTVLE